MLSGRKPSPWFTAPSSEKYRSLRCDPILCNWYIEPRRLGISEGRWKARSGHRSDHWNLLARSSGKYHAHAMFMLAWPSYASLDPLARASVAVDCITFQRSARPVPAGS